jgi:hypothetical protein
MRSVALCDRLEDRIENMPDVHLARELEGGIEMVKQLKMSKSMREDMVNAFWDQIMCLDLRQSDRDRLYSGLRKLFEL